MGAFARVLAMLAALSTPTVSQESSEFDALWARAMNNLSHEFSECAAYFYVVSVALENSGDPDTAAQYVQVAEGAVETATLLAQDAKILPETVAARVDLALQDMTSRIDGNTSNIAILGADYAQLCRSGIENLEARNSVLG